MTPRTRLPAGFLGALRAIAPVRLDEPLSRHTTFGAGGPADAYLAAETEDQLRLAYAAAKRHGVPVFIFGSGSNVLVGDGGVRGLTIENRTGRIEGPSQNGAGFKVRAASGVSFAALARRLANAGYAGIEWACGIPGSLGGAVLTNAGAYGSSLSDVLKTVRLAGATGEVTEMTPEQLGLRYRESALTRGEIADAVVLSVDLRLQRGDPQALKARVRELDAQRKAAQPPGRNCGSVFKNPPDHPSWWYVDQAGLRGHRSGNAQISEKHANFILNLGGARAADIVALMELARARVREQFGVELQPEVMLVGEFE
ncbi:MAG: UDP-N-acetylmuramate dehydrogenase [Dehalococcoidia bacterium]|nr:UDP-N-acetylmuramate dehydrogenase [Dehalococcoidia bacterium]